MMIAASRIGNSEKVTLKRHSKREQTFLTKAGCYRKIPYIGGCRRST